MARERAASFATLSEQKRKQAMARFVVLRPHLEEGVPLTCAAAAAGVPLRTAQRWLARYRQDGSTGLAGSIRRDAGRHRSPADLVALIEGMGLKKPRSSAAAIHRRVSAVAKAEGWRVPSYGTVHAILARLDPAMVTLAQDRRHIALKKPRHLSLKVTANHVSFELIIEERDGMTGGSIS